MANCNILSIQLFFIMNLYLHDDGHDDEELFKLKYVIDTHNITNCKFGRHW